MKRLVQYSVVCWILLCTLILPTSIDAQTNQGALEVPMQYTFPQSVVQQTTPQTYYFQIAETTTVQDATLQLDVQTSPSVLPEQAYLTVSFNGVPVTSQRLTPGKHETFTVQLPNQLFQTHNNLQISGFLKSTTLTCEPTDEVNWFVLSDATKLTYTSKTQQPTIAQWFLQTQHDEQQFSIAMPEAATPFNSTQLVNLVAVIEQRAKQAGIQADITQTTYKNAKKNRPVIYIGTMEQLNQQFTNAFTKEEQAMYTQNGGMKWIQSNGQWQLCVMTHDESQITTLNEMLSYPDTLAQLQTTAVTLTDLAPHTFESFQSSGTFANLKYDTMTQTGTGTHTFQYFVPVPQSQVASDATLQFAYDISNTIDFERSFVQVKINGEIVETQPIIHTNTTERIYLDVDIPNDIAMQGAWNISVSFELYTPVMSCDMLTNTGAYVRMEPNESTYDMKLSERSVPTIQTSAALMQDEQGRLSGTITIDDTYRTTVDLIPFIQQIASQSRGIDYVNVVETPSQGEAMNRGVFITTPTQTTAIAVSQTMPYQLAEDGTIIGQADFVQVTDILGQIQVNDNIMLVAAPTEQQVQALFTRYRTQAYDVHATSVLVHQDQVVQQYENTQAKHTQQRTFNAQIGIPVIITGCIGVSVCIWIGLTYKKKQQS
ncbi:MAG: cellulose biosynthesis cyclic di-GMP-binding regulatory protein BcsB [Culicoidibacterales bacterium]